ncbi:hypothetical protein RRSWK_01591 [Rhodopirellula sp. SWK7]|nr:hypothetical protein RRSWK_01591 [Rhodopirellula sp. SWK7]
MAMSFFFMIDSAIRFYLISSPTFRPTSNSGSGVVVHQISFASVSLNRATIFSWVCWYSSGLAVGVRLKAHARAISPEVLNPNDSMQNESWLRFATREFRSKRMMAMEFHFARKQELNRKRTRLF